MFLEEEMCCTIAYGHWKADWWQCHAELWSQLDPVLGGADSCLAEGLHSYVAEHVHLELSLASQLEDKFQDIRECVRTVLADLDNGTVIKLTSQTAVYVDLELEFDDGDEQFF